MERKTLGLQSYQRASVFTLIILLIISTIFISGNQSNSYAATSFSLKQVVSVTGISINKTAMSIKTGAVQTLLASVLPTNATNQSGTYTSNSTAATVDQNGTVKGVNAGTAVITARTADGGFKAYCIVTVTAPTAPAPTVPAPSTVISATGISINKTAMSIQTGAVQTLLAIVLPTNATNQSGTYTSNSTAATVDQNGTVKGVNAGTAVITARTADGGFKAYCTVTVTAPTAPAPTVANSYYVSTRGNDLNPGTITQPWKTVQKAANAAVAGNVVYIRGGTYNERVIIKNSGTTANYITFSNYPGETAIIDGTNLSWGQGGALVDVVGRSYIKIIGLKVNNSPWAGIGTPYGSGANYIEIRNCSTYRSQISGIIITNGSHITVDGNTIDTANLYAQDEALSISNIDTFQVSNNTIVNSKKESLDAKDGSRNGKIFNNTISNGVGVGLYIDAFSRASFNIEVYNNSITNCAYGVWICNETGGVLTNINVHDNIIKNCRIGLGIGFYFEGYSHPASGIIFNHNTLVGTTLYGVGLYNPQATGVKITNNSFGGTTTSIPIYHATGVPVWAYTIDGNALNKVVSGYPTGTNYTLIN